MSHIELDNLNPMQQEAVLHKDGPLLILAGAGSGKTRVLTNRIAYLIEEYGVNPYNILALTFTNKAAKEMRDRVDQSVTYGSESIWVSTFHSTCVRILRRNIERLGYTSNFTIYDSEDQKTLVKDILKYLNIDSKKFKERSFMSAISSAKDELKTPAMFEAEMTKEYGKDMYAKVYHEYQKRLKSNNALDFDDLIMKTVELFQTNPDVLDNYQRRFQYILVDEYQDTNTAQFMLLSLLAQGSRNLCVVGDDDQSIYKFRGANIYNILNFEKVFPDAKVIRLEQNYRSTGNILKAANEVIKHNTMRKEKALWTDAEDGEPLSYAQFMNEYEEASGIVSDIRRRRTEENLTYDDFAILYRTNAQSRVFEEKFILQGIPYRIVGAINFYSRREIKDLLAYLKAVNNSNDDLAIRRIINVPKRGIGLTTIDRITTYSIEHGLSFYDALRSIDYIDGCGRAASKIIQFVSIIEHLKNSLLDPSYSLKQLIDDIIHQTGYVRLLEEENTEESQARIENIQELINKIVQYEESCVEEPATLLGLLEEIALVADIDTVDENAEQVLLMTLHSAKGLEFPYVYMCGMEENVFPGGMAIFSDDDAEIEEERRLCYVGITRAMKKLTLTSAQMRMRNGETNVNRPSRFITEIPRHLLTQDAAPVEKKHSSFQFGSSSGGGMKTMHGLQGGSTYRPSSKASVYDTENKRNPFASNPYIRKGATNATSNMGSEKPTYDVGDTVSHLKFGSGVVESITKLDKDYEVMIHFDKFGERKLRSSFAKLKKVKE